MRLLIHHDLDTHRVRAQFAKLQQALARDDFKSPNLKKLHPTPYWRFKLDQTNRLLVSYKKLYSQLVPNPQVQRNLIGYCADHLMRSVERIPDSVLSPQRKKRSYFNGVLARAELNSAYQPSRQLWLRNRNGYYILNPDLKLRTSSTAEWLPWAQWLNQPLVYAGCGIRTSESAGIKTKE